MKTCKLCNTTTSPLRLRLVWDKEIQLYMEHYVCSKCWPSQGEDRRSKRATQHERDDRPERAPRRESTEITERTFNSESTPMYGSEPLVRESTEITERAMDPGENRDERASPDS